MKYFKLFEDWDDESINEASLQNKSTGYDYPAGSFDKYIMNNPKHEAGVSIYQLDKNSVLYDSNLKKTDIKLNKGDDIILNAKDRKELKSKGSSFFAPIKHSGIDYYLPLSAIRKPTGKAVELINPDLTSKSDSSVFHDFKGGHAQEANICRLFVEQTNQDWGFEYIKKLYDVTYLGDPSWKGVGNPKNDLQIEFDKSPPKLDKKLKISLKADNATYVENWMKPDRALQIFDKSKLKQIILELYDGFMQSKNPLKGDGILKGGNRSTKICMFIKDKPPNLKISGAITDKLTNAEAFEAYTGSKKFKGTDGDTNFFYKGPDPKTIQEFLGNLTPITKSLSGLHPLYVSLRGSNEPGKVKQKVMEWNKVQKRWELNPLWMDAAGISGTPENNYGRK